MITIDNGISRSDIYMRESDIFRGTQWPSNESFEINSEASWHKLILNSWMPNPVLVNSWRQDFFHSLHSLNTI